MQDAWCRLLHWAQLFCCSTTRPIRIEVVPTAKETRTVGEQHKRADTRRLETGAGRGFRALPAGELVNRARAWPLDARLIRELSAVYQSAL